MLNNNDTAALRALADAAEQEAREEAQRIAEYRRRKWFEPRWDWQNVTARSALAEALRDPDTVRGLCDAADEVERLRDEVAKHPGELDRITYLRAGVITAERDSFTAWVCACGHPRTTHTPLDFGDCTECPHGTCGKHPGLRWDIWHRDTLRERDAARAAHADLVADLRALCLIAESTHDASLYPADVLALLDRHAPEDTDA